MTYKLQDLIDIEHFQRLQDRLNEICSFPSSIIDNEGNILTATAWQDACTKFHRANVESERICRKSDQYILDHLHEADPLVTYRCPHGLVDNAFPIIIDGVHYGNFFTGQFFLEPPDIDFFVNQAKKYGYDTDAYLQAVKKVPVWSQQQFDSYIQYIKELISTISESGLKRLREIQARKAIDEADQRYRSIILSSMDGFWMTDTDGAILEVNDTYCSMSGYDKSELLNMRILDLDAHEDIDEFNAHMQKVVETGADIFTTRHRRKDGSLFDVEISVQFHPFKDGVCVCFLRDITERIRVEEELRESKEQYQFIIEHTADLIWAMDSRLKLLYMSPSCEQILGYAPGEWDDLTWEDIVLPDHLDTIYSTFYELKKKREDSSVSAEIAVRQKNGQTRWMEFNVASIWIDGVLTGFSGVSRDITERKKAETELREANTKMLLAAHAGQFGIWEMDLSSGELKWDPMMYRLYGIGTEEFEGTYDSWKARVHPDDLQAATREVEQAIRGEKDFRTEFRIVRPDKTICYIEAHAVVSHNENGEPGKLTGINIDITEKKKKDLALQESEARFRALHNASFGGIAIHDKGVILECNQGLSQITGYDHQELIGMDGLLLISDDTRDLVIKNIAAGFELPYEAKGRRKDGEIYPLRLEAKNIPYRGRKVRVVEFRDISEQKNEELQRELLEAQLRQAQKLEAVGRLAGGIAHDFNNLIGLVIGYTEMALEDIPLSSPLCPILEEIKNAGHRTAELTRQLLAFARKDAVVPKTIDLNSTIDGMITMLKRLIGENITLNWRPCSELGLVRIDPGQIDQILVNLCINARDAIADLGEISISTSNVAVEEEFQVATENIRKGRYVLITVADSGSGMLPETIEKIFEPFYTTKEQGKGTGLGLATVFGIVKQNNGFIAVDSSVNSGTIFAIFLPRQQQEQQEQDNRKKDPQAAHADETVLLVEDDAAILAMTHAMLERLGYNVLAANTAHDAVTQAENCSGKVDLLLTDVIMPEMNGRDLAECITSIYPDIKILYMSGYTADIISNHGILEEGMNYIQKPFTRKDLGSSIIKVLDSE